MHLTCKPSQEATHLWTSQGTRHTCVTDEEVHRGVGSPIRREAHAVALVHGARPRVGVHMAVPGGIHLQEQSMSHGLLHMHLHSLIRKLSHIQVGVY